MHLPPQGPPGPAGEVGCQRRVPSSPADTPVSWSSLQLASARPHRTDVPLRCFASALFLTSSAGPGGEWVLICPTGRKVGLGGVSAEAEGSNDLRPPWSRGSKAVKPRGAHI